MTAVGLLPSPSSSAAPLEPVTATRRPRDDSPYGPKHATFSSRAARSPPDLLGTERMR